MPFKTKKIGKKFRVVKSSTGKIAKNRSGTAIDGGGSTSRAKVIRQITALNLAELRKEGRDVPMPRSRRRRR
jgi:hypothetical protein